MKHRSFLTAWMQKSFLLSAVVSAFTCAVYAQANFISVIGDHGCGSGDHHQRLSCNTTPSSSALSAINFVDDHYTRGFGYSGTTNPMLYNSVYDISGNLLFSANADGIYGNSGNVLFDFVSSITSITPPDCSVGNSFSPYAAASEICIIPKPGNPNKYYAIFWCSVNQFPFYAHVHTSDYLFLRAVEITVNPASLSDGSYSFTDHYLAPGDCYLANRFSYQGNGMFEVVANAPNCDNSIDIYTVHPDNSGSNYYGTVLSWHIDASGTLPDASTASYSVVSAANTLLVPGVTKCKIFQMPNSSGGTDPVLAYAGMDHPALSGGLNPNKLQTLNLNTLAHNVYTAPGSTLPYSEIWGYEYLAACGSGTFCFSYLDPTPVSGPIGGLGYATPATGTGVNTAITPISSTIAYANSDLELNRHGDLLMVANPLTGTWPVDGKLAYLDKSYLTSVPSLTTHAPTIITSACSSYISVSNLMYTADDDAFGYYLGTQNRSAAFPATYTVTGTEVWTSTNNPVTNVTGVATGTISANNIVITAGASLTIQTMTVQLTHNSHVDVYGTSLTSSGRGGRFVLDHATLTHLTSGCGSSNMWGGVRVWGNPVYDQYPLATTSQGMITLYNNSVISYADTGVFCGPNPFLFSPMCGGICQANNSTFYNNNYGAVFAPYYRMGKDNASLFKQCTFNSDDASTVTGAGCTGTLVGIAAYNVRGIKVKGCHFSNNTGLVTNTYGIYGKDIGILVSGYATGVLGTGTFSYAPSIFDKYNIAIFAAREKFITTVLINGSVFNDNQIGAELDGIIAPVVTFNTFNVPYGYPSPMPRYYFYPQNIGLLLNAANLYTVSNNTLQISYPTSTGYPPANKTVGVLALNTGGDENIINNNVYTSLGAGNLSNDKNMDGLTGLWYKCNSYTGNSYDEDAEGADPSAKGHGIRNTQGVQPYAHYPATPLHLGPAYPNGVASGNIFSTGSAYNLYCSPGTYPFYYAYYDGTGSSPLEKPGASGVTGVNFGIAPINVYTVSPASQCPVAGNVSLGMGSSTDFGSTSGTFEGHGFFHTPVPVRIMDGTDAVVATMDTKLNISYYLLDSVGLQQRDSLYYWVDQLQSSSGERIKANLLLEDGYTDSAYAVYNSIPANYTLDIIDSIEHVNWGARIFDVQSNLLSKYAHINTAIAEAELSSNPDSLLAGDTTAYYRPELDSSSLASLIEVFNGSRYWGRLYAETILFSLAPDTINVLLTVTPDTLRYPEEAEEGEGKQFNGGETVNPPGNEDTKPSVKAAIKNSIYPNPVNNTLQVIYQPAGNNSIILKIDDVIGRQMITQSLQGGRNTIDVSKLPPGAYLYKVYEGNNLTMRGKVMKE